MKLERPTTTLALPAYGSPVHVMGNMDAEKSEVVTGTVTRQGSNLEHLTTGPVDRNPETASKAKPATRDDQGE